MSEYIRKVVEYDDEEAFCEAIGEAWARGGVPVPVERHDTPVGLYGYHGDERPERAHIVVRRANIAGGANDVGFRRLGAGKYEEIVSKNERGWAREKVKSLKKLYAEKVVHKAVLARRMRVTSRVVEATGKIVLRVAR